MRHLFAIATVTLLLGACTESQQPNTATPATTTGPKTGSPMTASGKFRIALLLPLSGRSAPIGQDLQQAAELALFEAGAKELALANYDSGDTPDQAAQAYRKARTDGTALVLGPLFGPSATALAPLVKEGGANVISFSNDEQAGRPGAWIMGIATPPQVRRVVDHAMSVGIRRFAAFAPSTTYGDQMVRTLQTYVSQRGGQMVATEIFPENLDLTPAAKRLSDAIGKDSGKTAVLVPVAPPRLSSVLASLSAAGVDNNSVQLIGTGVWDVAGIGSEALLRGAWYAAPDPTRRADFERKFVATYGRPPRRLASLAYDAVALAGRLARLKPGGDFSAEAITSPNGWSGVDGVFRFLPDGRVERTLAVIEIQGDRSVVVSPAPSSFVSAATN
jgi:ABC-type branched-subunit amino acid transport system substrate-binding protein